MKNLFFSLAFILVGFVGFAKSANETSQKFLNDPVKIVLDLGDQSKLSELQLHNFLENLPKIFINGKNIDECSITYTMTVTFFGQSASVSATGTAKTCEEAGNIARAGLRTEIKKAREFIEASLDQLKQ